jgi:branched-chain amino acid aminotransferase
MNECLLDNFLLNGEIKSREEFKDPFLVKGKSFYEVIRIINGCYVFTEDHIERLRNSLRIFNINYNFENELIIDYLLKYKLKNSINSGNVRLVINFNKSTTREPGILVYSIAHKYPTADNYRSGIDTSIIFIERKMPNAKFVNPTVLAAVNRELSDSSVYETLLTDSEGYITEGSKSNVFFIGDNIIYTPPENKVLPGITRKYILIICKELNYKLIEKNISINSLNEYDTVFISGTSAKILAVKRISDHNYNVNNKMLKSIADSYDGKIGDYILKYKEN